MLDVLELGLLAVVLWKLFGGQATFKGKQAVILDSCALIDGRVTELARSGFLSQTLIVPEFVIHELQLLADGSDMHKRSRARYGLDVIKDLQQDLGDHLVVEKVLLPDIKNIDDKLVKLATQKKALLYTTDYNLGKVAEIAGVKVLNVNELAGVMRPILLPGEEQIVKIIQKGSGANQGVGYAEDGTMLVVENGMRFIGKTVKVSVTRMHQTQSGKMIFAEIIAAPRAEKPSQARRTVVLRRPRRRIAQKV